MPNSGCKTSDKPFRGINEIFFYTFALVFMLCLPTWGHNIKSYKCYNQELISGNGNAVLTNTCDVVWQKLILNVNMRSFSKIKLNKKNGEWRIISLEITGNVAP